MTAPSFIGNRRQARKLPRRVAPFRALAALSLGSHHVFNAKRAYIALVSRSSRQTQANYSRMLASTMISKCAAKAIFGL